MFLWYQPEHNVEQPLECAMNLNTMSSLASFLPGLQFSLVTELNRQNLQIFSNSFLNDTHPLLTQFRWRVFPKVQLTMTRHRLGYWVDSIALLELYNHSKANHNQTMCIYYQILCFKCQQNDPCHLCVLQHLHLYNTCGMIHVSSTKFQKIRIDITLYKNYILTIVRFPNVSIYHHLYINKLTCPHCFYLSVIVEIYKLH